MAGISATQAAEIKRKAEAGIPLTNPTAQSTAMYNQYKTAAPKAAAPAPMSAQAAKTPATAAPTTGAIPQTAPAPGSQASHQAYIDKTMGGAYSSGQYAQNNINRYNNGEITYDALAKDSARVGYAIPPMAQPAQQTYTPQPQTDYNAIAAAEQARYLAERQRIADQQKAGLTSAWNRSNQILQGNRTLEDLYIDRTLNPFSGRKSYAKGLTERERTLADESSQGNYNAAIQGVEQGLADDRNTAAQAIMARAYQLEQDAKQYGLDYAGLFGQLPGNGGSGGSPRTLAAQQQAYNQAADTRNYDRSVYESDRNYNFQKAQQDWENNFKQSQFDWQKAQQTWENAFQGRKFEQDMKEAAASRGLQWASLNQRQKEFVADQAFREKQFQFEQDKFSASQNGSKLSDKDSTDNFNMIFDDLQTQGVTKDKARQLLQANKGYLTDSDYAKLNNWINENL